MLRTILGVVLGIVAWVVTVQLISLAIKTADPALGAALLAHTTTTAMVERLVISFIATLAAGFVAAWVGGENQRAPMALGVLLLVGFVPYHLYGRDPQGAIWTSFPLWYHLTFFVSLVLLSVLGGRLRR
jgi:hypothetical protein